MYKKNSILDRPRRPPSARNVESAPIEHERALDKQARLSARYRNYAELDGYASRNAWSDPARLSSTKYDTLHGLQTVVGAKGLETAFRADVDFRSGVAKVPAPSCHTPWLLSAADKDRLGCGDYPPPLKTLGFKGPPPKKAKGGDRDKIKAKRRQKSRVQASYL